MDATLDTEPAVGGPTVDLHGHALEAGLLAFLLVDDLRMEVVALRPAELHPQQHLRPIGGLGSAGPGADRQERAPLVVLAREQERRPLATEVRLERGRLLVQLGGQFWITGLVNELEDREEVVGAGFKAPP